MELEDLRTTWESLKDKADSHIKEKTIDEIVSKRKNVKTPLLRRLMWGSMATLICLILMATSRLWAPMKFPYWWLSAFCGITFIGFIGEIKIYRSVRKINLWQDTNAEIMAAVTSVKKLYINLELAVSIVIAPLLIWLSFTPMFVNSWRMFFAWGLTLLAFVLEYIWYKHNIRHLNKFTQT